MNGSHVAAASGLVGNIASMIVWISNAIATGHWFPISSETSIAMASLIVSGLGGTGVAAWIALRKDKASVTVTTEETKP